MTEIQLSLFDDETPHGNDGKSKNVTGVNWSFSRRSMLEQCARRYYYEYYGASKRNALSEPDKDQLHNLKRIENRFARAGSILHLVISQYFRQAQNGISWDLNKLQNWAKDLFMKDINYSYADPDGLSVHRESYPPILLQEFNQRLTNAKDMCLDLLERTLDSLTSFYVSEKFLFYREAGKTKGSLIEHLFKLKRYFVRIDGKIDLAFIDQNAAFIVDWKSGRSDAGGDDSLQLATYALWAADYFKFEPNKIRVMKAYLSDAAIVEFKVDERLLDLALARILQDAERMASVTHYGKDGIASAFTPCAHKLVCQLCSFVPACEEGKQSLYD